MTELRKCSRCRSVIELTYFGINRKGEYNKTCINCLDKKKERDAIKTVCDNCGCDVNKGTLSIHKRRFYCQVYNMETKPDFEEWLINQDYDKILYEYNDLLEYILTITSNCNSEVCKSNLLNHQRTNKCKNKPHPNDKYVIVDGRVYDKGKSPFEGVWYDDHIPFDLNNCENKQILS